MRRFQQIVIPVFAACGLFVLIMDTETAIAGAQEGIGLCIRSLIPSLFPLMVVSAYFCNVYARIKLPLLKPIMRFCRIPEGAESLFVIGILGGYPVGAKAIADAHRQGKLEHNAAKRMLCFCNNAGPAFIFGIVGCQFDNALIPWLILFVQVLSAVVTGYLIPGQTGKFTSAPSTNTKNFVHTFHDSLKAICTVCGWIILFRTLLAILYRWLFWVLPSAIQVVLTGVLEISNGCLALDQIQNAGLKFIMCSGLLSFGGICVYLQTVSVSGAINTSLYFPGKFLQCLVSILLSGIVQAFVFTNEQSVSLQFFLLPTVIITILILVKILVSNKKTVAICGKPIYNIKN